MVTLHGCIKTMDPLGIGTGGKMKRGIKDSKCTVPHKPQVWDGKGRMLGNRRLGPTDRGGRNDGRKAKKRRQSIGQLGK